MHVCLQVHVLSLNQDLLYVLTSDLMHPWGIIGTVLTGRHIQLENTTRERNFILYTCISPSTANAESLDFPATLKD